MLQPACFRFHSFLYVYDHEYSLRVGRATYCTIRERGLLVVGGRSPRFSPDGKWISYLNTSETGGDVLAANTRWLYRIPAQGGSPLRLARKKTRLPTVAAGARADSRATCPSPSGCLADLLRNINYEQFNTQLRCGTAEIGQKAHVFKIT